jgi:hypothetical protein
VKLLAGRNEAAFGMQDAVALRAAGSALSLPDGWRLLGGLIAIAGVLPL